MFQNLEIRNFRLFEHLKLDHLGQINLLAGRNNSGKTTLLEALFMLSGAGDPELILRINHFRTGELRMSRNARDIFLKPLFYQFNLDKIIEIASGNTLLGSGLITRGCACPQMGAIRRRDHSCYDQ